MLTIYFLPTPDSHAQVFEPFNARTQTWVVSDLRSKLEIQDRLLNRDGFIEGQSVIRVSELWRTLLLRTRPDLRVVSREFVLTILSQKLSVNENLWARSPNAHQTLYDYMTQLMPILSHPQGAEMLGAWLLEHPESEQCWGDWARLSFEMWAWFLNEGFVSPQWISGVLVNENLDADVWSRKLTFDLGSELTQVEADLLVSLSDHNEIEVLRPDPEWRERFRSTLLAYEILQQKIGDVKLVHLTRTTSLSTKTCTKLSTMLGEVKHATAMVRGWLDRGEANINEIGLVAPEVETYWPVLREYFKIEGLPLQKSVLMPLHSEPNFAKWLAILRTRSGGLNESDLEAGLFEAEAAPPLSFEKFRSLFANLYTPEDLARLASHQDIFSADLPSDHMLSRNQFLLWSLRSLEVNVSQDHLESVFRRVLDEAPEFLELSLHRWVQYLQQITARIEVCLQPAETNGVLIMNLLAAENSGCKKMILLNLTESALIAGRETNLLLADILSLQDQFGFHLLSQDQRRLEFELRWLLESGGKDFQLFSPMSSFEGDVQSPSLTWLESATSDEEIEKTVVPWSTRFDLIQQMNLADLMAARGFAKSTRTQFDAALLSEFTGMVNEFQFLPVDANRVRAISASGLEDFMKCPFVFAAKRHFHLSDEDELDVDLSRRQSGVLIHAVIAKLLERESLQYSDIEIVAVIESCVASSETPIHHDLFWVSQRNEFLKQARQFLAFEADWRTRFPLTKTLGLEVKVDGWYDVESGRFLPSTKIDAETAAIARPKKLLRVKGALDRVDTQRGHEAGVVILDYKSSTKSLKGWKGWLKDRQVQMLFYTLAVEAGLLQLDATENTEVSTDESRTYRPTVWAANYFDLNDLTRAKGFKLNDVRQNLFSFADRERDAISSEEKATLFGLAELEFKQAIERLLAGEIKPKPYDERVCLKCNWRQLCRAPHLQ